MSQQDWAEPVQGISEPEIPEQAGGEEQVVEAESDFEPAARQQSFLIPTLFLLLIGGLLGWIIGRQSSVQRAPGFAPANPIVISTPTAEVAVTSPVAVVANLTPVAATLPANQADAAMSRPSAGPTPASIAPDPLKAMGNPDAPVTIVEFSDYQCPFCLRNFQETFPQLKAEYIDTGRVYFIFKDFPITGIHPTAPRVHEAARCAGEGGDSELYWQVHDSFFNNQAQWANQPQPELDNTLISLTSEVGAAEDKLRDCLDSGRTVAAVQADMAEGQRLGIGGTPTFFINGYPMVGALPYNVFQQAIALAETGQLGEALARSAEQNAAQAQPTASPGPQPPAAAQAVDVPVGDAPGWGDPNAPVVLVEYSDFQCPFCLRHFTDTKPQLQSYIDAGQVYYVFKDFPLPSIHPQAQKAHESARCARELGGDEGFWTMHDLLFTNQQQWAGNSDPVALFKTLATEAGLPQAEFAECVDSGRQAAAVAADLAEGQQLGIRGTPAFFINGQPLIGAQPFAVFQRMIDGLLAQ